MLNWIFFCIFDGNNLSSPYFLFLKKSLQVPYERTINEVPHDLKPTIFDIKWHNWLFKQENSKHNTKMKSPQIVSFLSAARLFYLQMGHHYELIELE